MALLVLVLYAVLVLLLVLAAASCRRYGTWLKKGVPHSTPWPLFGNCFRLILQQEPLYTTVDRLCKRFPGQPLVGMYAGPSPVLIVRDPEMIKQITIKDFHVFTNHKFSPRPEIDPQFSQFLFCQLDQRWKEVRVKLSPAFSSGRLKTMYPIVERVANQLVDSIRAAAAENGVVAVNRLSSLYGVDVIGSCAFGCDVAALRDGSDSPFLKAVEAAFNLGPLEGLSLFLLLFVPSLYRLLRVPLFKAWRYTVVMDLLQQAAQHREKEPPQSRDIFDLLLKLRKDGDLPLKVVEAQVMAMQVAGSETSATTLAFVMWELAKHEDVQQRLRNEIKAAVDKDGGQLTYETMHALPYLDMVFKETLRLWPVMPWLDRECSEDYVLPGANVKIEKGTVVLVPSFSIHRDPDFFSDPETFHPERFAPENMSSNKAPFLAFGSGPRICIGGRFADMSVKTAVCKLLLNFRVSMTPATPSSFEDLPKTKSAFLLNMSEDLLLHFHHLG